MGYGRLLTLWLLMTLAGCGFHLRGTGVQQSITGSVHVVHVAKSSTPSALSATLVKSLERSNAELADSHADADYVLRIDDETIRRRPVASTGQASVAEYELRLEVGFSVLAQARLIGSGEVFVERIYQFDSSSLAGNTAEEAVLTREMREDVSGQLLRRLDALIRSAD